MRKIGAIISFLLISISLYAQINKKALDTLLNEAVRSASDALIIMHNDKLIIEYYSSKGPELIYLASITKSFVNLAFGLLYTKGLITSLDVPIMHWFPEWNQGKKKNITLRNLLNHTSGLQDLQSDGPEIDPAPNAVQLALAAELMFDSGTQFFYSNKAVNLLPALIEKITGKKIDTYLAQELFKPLGITQYKWDHDHAGNPYGMSGLWLLPRDLIKIGQLVLHNGMWHNKRLISPDWFKQSFSAAQPFADQSGLLWWLIPDSTTYVIDEQQLEKIKSAGANELFLKQLEALKGTYKNDQEFDQKLDQVLGAEWQKILEKELPENCTLSKKYVEHYKGIYTEGYRGEYLVIYPQKKLIGIRLINRGSYKNETNSMPNFNDLFSKLIE